MIAISHNMVHGALRTIIIHKKEYWNKRVRLTHRGPVNMDIVLYITYLNVYLRWDCFILFQVSPRYLKWSLCQHPICGSKYWPGTEQASCHLLSKDGTFDRCICGSFGLLCEFKGLRPVLEGFVVTMHEGACETGSQIPRALARGIWRTVRTSPSALWQQTPTDRS